MNRRELLVLGSTAIAWPFTAHAQQKAMPVIGWLSSMSSTASGSQLAAFRQRLSEAGYVEGDNLAIEYRWAEDRYDRLPGLAQDLVRRQVMVIVAVPHPAAVAAKAATATIPIVFTSAVDPVREGLVKSLGRPGGNVTGVSQLIIEMGAKRWELLHELATDAAVFGLIVNPNNPNAESQAKDAGEAARSAGMRSTVVHAGGETELAAAFAKLKEQRAEGLIVGADPAFSSAREQLVGLAAAHAIPTIYSLREYTVAGGLISYGTSLSAATHQVGLYTGKIIAGAKPADLPVVQPTKFELVINLKTAKALGLTVPQSLFARADEVIE